MLDLDYVEDSTGRGRHERRDDRAPSASSRSRGPRRRRPSTRRSSTVSSARPPGCGAALAFQRRALADRTTTVFTLRDAAARAAATANAGKATELQILLDGLGYAIVSLKDLADVASRRGATSYREMPSRRPGRSRGPRPVAVAVGDDSGLEVDALGGRPGVGASPLRRTRVERRRAVDAAPGRARPTPARARASGAFLAMVAPWREEAVIEDTVEGVLTDFGKGPEAGQAPRLGGAGSWSKYGRRVVSAAASRPGHPPPPAHDRGATR